MLETYQIYRIAECTIGQYDCAHDWRLTGTLAGICLEFDPNKGPNGKDAVSLWSAKKLN